MNLRKHEKIDKEERDTAQKWKILRNMTVKGCDVQEQSGRGKTDCPQEDAAIEIKEKPLTSILFYFSVV